MQNLIKAIAPAALVTILLSSNASAQNMMPNNSAKNVNSYTAETDKTNPSTKLKKDIATNPIVVAKFSALFPEAASTQWTSTNDNIWVSFLNNGRKARACFNEKGKMSYVISDCGMEQLPAAFSNTIKKDYPSYHLYNAVEITAHDVVAYEAVLENSVHFITLKYTSDGIQETKQVTKTN